jgi:C-terminal processing protease CtpA/Prc
LVVAQVSEPWQNQLRAGDRILSVNGDETARFGSRVLSHLRGQTEAQITVRRGDGIEKVSLNVPKDLDDVQRYGVHVSGMVIGRSTIFRQDTSTIWVHFVDDASTAEQSMINEGDQLISVNGQPIKNLQDVLAAFQSVQGKDVEVIIRRPRFTLISGRYEYFVRNLEVKDVFEVNDNGRKR